MGTKLLTNYFGQKFPNGSRYSMLYFTKGYVSSARGGVFNELFQDQKHKLSSFQYTDATRASGYDMTKNLVATDPDIDFIYACATDIALGAIDALEDMGRQDIQVNGWGGGDAELKAIEQNKLTIRDAQTIVEMSTFVSRGSSYQAIAPNHDDLMMNLVMFAWFTTTDVFQSLTNIDMKNMLYKERLKEIQDDMLPFGFTTEHEEANKYIKDEQGNIWFEEKVWNGSTNI